MVGEPVQQGVREDVFRTRAAFACRLTYSLEMAGCSTTVTLAYKALLALWDAPVHKPTLRWGRFQPHTSPSTRIQLPDMIFSMSPAL